MKTDDMASINLFLMSNISLELKNYFNFIYYTESACMPSSIPCITTNDVITLSQLRKAIVRVHLMTIQCAKSVIHKGCIFHQSWLPLFPLIGSLFRTPLRKAFFRRELGHYVPSISPWNVSRDSRKFSIIFKRRDVLCRAVSHDSGYPPCRRNRLSKTTYPYTISTFPFC